MTILQIVKQAVEEIEALAEEYEIKARQRCVCDTKKGLCPNHEILEELEETLRLGKQLLNDDPPDLNIRATPFLMKVYGSRVLTRKAGETLAEFHRKN